MSTISDDDRIPDEIAQAIIEPAAYAEWNELHHKLAYLRRKHPFARGHVEGYDRFWVATKYEDIQEISRQHETFLSGISAIEPTKQLELSQTVGRDNVARSIVRMNEPEHMPMRLLAQAWFQPKNLRMLDERIRNLARRHVNLLADTGGECDYATVAGVHYPLLVIMSILGVPEEDEARLLQFTKDVTGETDPDLGIELQGTLEEREASRRKVLEDAWIYFNNISEQRRRSPTDDVATVIANGLVDGSPLSNADAMGYYLTIVVAGNDTTSSTMAGAMWALAERPGELAKVKADRSLIPRLVEEAVRWTTPLHHFTRTAAHDTQFRGQSIAKGDRVILSFPSGNRDEDIFDEPFEFRADRKNNKQIGFGYGIHSCLGMHLARMEMNIFFEEFLPRLESLELAGTPRRKVTNFIGGPKFVPIRFRLS